MGPYETWNTCRQIRVSLAQLPKYICGPSDVKAKTPSTAQLASGEDCPHEPFLHTCAARRTNGQKIEIPRNCIDGAVFHCDGGVGAGQSRGIRWLDGRPRARLPARLSRWSS